MKRRWGCAGLIIGAVLGLALMTLFLLSRSPAPTGGIQSAQTIPADVTVFVSGQTLSRMATAEIGRPTVIDFEPDGRLLVTTRAKIGGYEPVVQARIFVNLQGATVVSELQGIKLGFVTIPANWLPEETRERAAVLGDTIEAQIPPNFTLVGLNTSPGGVTFQLKWIGR